MHIECVLSIPTSLDFQLLELKTDFTEKVALQDVIVYIDRFICIRVVS